MSEPWDNKAQSRALWRRWNMGEKVAGGAAAGAMPPDELTLAAFAEGRLDAAAAADVAAFLANHPELAEDVAAAHRLLQDGAGVVADDPALAAVIARACALVPAADDHVIAFRPAPPRIGSNWHFAARWSALAASFAMVSYLGFALGSDASSSLATLDRSGTLVLSDEVLDPPTGFLGGFGELSGT